MGNTDSGTGRSGHVKEDRGALRAVSDHKDEQNANLEATVKDLQARLQAAAQALVAVRRKLSAMAAEIDKVVV